MNTSLAIAAITDTLYRLLHRGVTADVSGASVSTKPLDKVQNDNCNQINLFLYHTEPNAAWRNMDMPYQVRPGESAHPPLALNLYYLITAYGQNDNERLSHRLLGRAMSILHDHPVLGADEITIEIGGGASQYIHRQIERIRITPQPLSLDEMSKIWSAFQTQYRISVAYQVSAVLIESTRPPKAPLPVLSRGSEDQGSHVIGSPSPSLSEVFPPDRKSSAELGDTVKILGEHLDSGNLTVRFRNPHLTDLLELQPLSGGTATEMEVALPGISDDPLIASKWTPGFYTLSLVVRRPNLPVWTTNEVSLALAPTITQLDPMEAPQGDVTLTIQCLPQVRSEQRVALLFGDREIPAQPFVVPADPSAATTLTFQISGADAGQYVVRLRVDGVDSIPVDFTADVPQFDGNRKVTIRE